MQYLSIVHNLEKQCKGITLQHIDRSKNEEADTLAKAAARRDPMPSGIFFHVVGATMVTDPDGLKITKDPNDQRIISCISYPRDTRIQEKAT